MFTVTPGPFAVLDVDGNALCHGARQTKASLNSTRRNDVKNVWKDALTSAGLSDGHSVVLAAGPADMVRAPFGPGVETRDGLADFGHVVADTSDGAYCGCNAVPVEGATNRDNGEARQAITHWSAAQADAYRVAFRAAAMARMTKTKRARVV